MHTEDPTLDPDDLLAHGHWMRALARGLLGDTARAEDVVQEAWLAAVTRPPRSQGSSRAWLTRVVRNFALRARTADARRRAREERTARPERDDDTPDRVLERAELHRAVVEAVLALEEPLRTTVLRRYFDGRSPAEIARRDGVHVATVRWRLRKALALLRERLDRAHDGQRDAWQGILLPLALPAAVPAGAGAAGAATAMTSTSSATTLLPVGGIITVSLKKIAATFVASLVLLGLGVLVVRELVEPDASAPVAAPLASERVVPIVAVAPAGGTGAAGTDTPSAAPATDARELAAPENGAPAALAGSVRDAAGRPIPRAEIVAIDLEDWEELVDDARTRTLVRATHDVSREFRELFTLYELSAMAQESAIADADGVYRFERLLAEEYRVVVTHDDHLPDITDLTVLEGEGRRHDVVLGDALSIEGRVTDAAGNPLAGVRINAELSSARSLRAARAERLLALWREGSVFFTRPSTTSAADGSFRLSGLAALRYDVVGRADGRVPSQALSVRPGDDRVELVLASAHAVRGRLVDRRGRACAEVGVVVSRAADAPAVPSEAIGLPPAQVAVPGNWDFQDDADREVRTGEGGEFIVSGLAPAEYELTARRSSAADLRHAFSVTDGPVDLGDLVLEEGLPIAGRVTDRDGGPVAGALVWIEDPAPRGITHWGGPKRFASALRETRTDAAGRFELPALAPGVYRVRATSAEHGEGSATAVRAGAVDAGIELPSGRTLHGVVRDALDGRPVEDARVEVLDRASRAPVREKTARTGADGRFELRGIAADDVLVRVRHDDYPGRGVEGLARASGEPLELELSPSLPVRGRVVDAAREPVSRARVSAEIVARYEDGSASTSALGSTVTSATDGTFTLEVDASLVDLADVSIEIVARHPRWGVGRSPAVPLADVLALGDDDDVVAGDGDEGLGVEVALEKAFGLEGSVRGEDGAVRGARVRIVPAALGAGNAAEAAALEAWSGAGGEYRFDLLEEGEYRLSVDAAGHAPLAGLSAVVGPDGGRVDVQLERGATLEGRVVDTRGAPVSGADVHVLAAVPADFEPEQGGEWARSQRKENGKAFATARSDGSGGYRVDDLPREDVTLFAAAPGYEASALVPVRAGGAPPDLVLSRFASLAGRVVEAERGRPVSPVMVLLNLQKNRRGIGGSGMLLPREFTAPDGDFVFDAIPPGDYFVVIEAPDHAVWGRDITLAPGAEEALDVRLDRGASVAGRVVDAESGQPIENVLISPTERDQAAWSRRIMPTWQATRTARDGSFVLRGLSAGKHVLYVHSEGYSLEGEQVDVLPGSDEANDVVIRLRRAGVVEGRVRFLAERQSFERSVRLRRTDDPDGRTWGAQLQGESFRIDAVPPGEYEAFVDEKRFAPHLQNAPPGTAIDLEKDVETTRTPLGTIKIAPGETYRIEESLP